MKKKIAFLLAFALISVNLTACNKNQNENGDSSNVNSSVGDISGDVSDITPDMSSPAVPDDDEVPVDDDVTAAPPPIDEPVAVPEQTQKPKPQTAPDKQDESNTPSKAPSDTAKSPAVSDIAAAVDKALGVDSNFMTFTADDISASYGIDSASMTEFVGKMPMMSVKATEYLIVKAADGKVDAVKNGMLKRQSDLDAQWKQYLPEQYELVKNYQLVSNGNYVLFAIGENVSAAVESFNSLTK